MVSAGLHVDWVQQWLLLQPRNLCWSEGWRWCWQRSWWCHLCYCHALGASIFSRGHNLFFDNYYTSPQVLGELLLNHVGACNNFARLVRVFRLWSGMPTFDPVRHLSLSASTVSSTCAGGIRDRSIWPAPFIMRTHFSGSSALETLNTSWLSRSHRIVHSLYGWGRPSWSDVVDTLTVSQDREVVDKSVLVLARCLDGKC